MCPPARVGNTLPLDRSPGARRGYPAFLEPRRHDPLGKPSAALVAPDQLGAGLEPAAAVHIPDIPDIPGVPVVNMAADCPIAVVGAGV